MNAEHIVELFSRDMPALRQWLQNPNGAFCDAGPRITLEAVQGGGILVRTRPFQGVDKGLWDFIAHMEKHYFRTDADTGANENALFVWNLVREYAGLPKLTLKDLPAFCVTCGRYHKNPCKRKEEA